MNRRDTRDCPHCFAKNCECECATCKAARERNNRLSQRELDVLNLEEAIKHRDKNESK